MPRIWRVVTCPGFPPCKSGSSPPGGVCWHCLTLCWYSSAGAYGRRSAGRPCCLGRGLCGGDIRPPGKPHPGPSAGSVQSPNARGWRAAGDEVADFGGHVCILTAEGRHFDQALQIQSGPNRVHGRQYVGVADYAALPGLDAAMAASTRKATLLSNVSAATTGDKNLSKETPISFNVAGT